jgi:hypothetical protein
MGTAHREHDEHVVIEVFISGACHLELTPPTGHHAEEALQQAVEVAFALRRLRWWSELRGERFNHLARSAHT